MDKRFLKNKSLLISLSAAFLFFAILGISKFHEYLTEEGTIHVSLSYSSEETLPNFHSDIDIDVELGLPSEINPITRDINNEIRLAKGLMLFYNQQYQDAIRVYTTVIKSDPGNIVAYNRRGNVYQRIKQYDMAEADYTEVLKLDPTYVKAYNNRGNVYSKLHKYDAAIADYNQALRISPNFSVTYYNRGNVYVKLEDYEAALADYNRAIKLEPYEGTYYNNRGALYKKLGEIEKANADFAKANKYGVL